MFLKTILGLAFVVLAYSVEMDMDSNDNINDSGSKPVIYCHKTTPCGWQIYGPPKDFYINNNYCTCQSEYEICRPYRDYRPSESFVEFRCLEADEDYLIIMSNEIEEWYD